MERQEPFLSLLTKVREITLEYRVGGCRALEAAPVPRVVTLDCRGNDDDTCSDWHILHFCCVPGTVPVNYEIGTNTVLPR